MAPGHHSRSARFRHLRFLIQTKHALIEIVSYHAYAHDNIPHCLSSVYRANESLYDCLTLAKAGRKKVARFPRDALITFCDFDQNLERHIDPRKR